MQMDDDSFNLLDYPISLGALPFLCDASAWHRYITARTKWMVAAKDIDAKLRANISKGYPVFRHGLSAVPTKYLIYAGTVGLDQGFGERPISLRSDQAAAFDEFEESRSNLKFSAMSRIKSGCIKVWVRADALSPWSFIDAEAFKDRLFDFRMEDQIKRRWRDSVGKLNINGGWKTFKSVRLRDESGISLHQALYAYGQRDKVIEIETLETYGAPNHIGKRPVVDHGGVIDSATTRWYELHDDLFSGLQSKIAAARLILIGDSASGEAGSIIATLRDKPVDEWPMDILVRPSAGPQEMARSSPPGAVRPTDNLDRAPADPQETAGSSKGRPGRPTVRAEIMGEFYAEYLTPDGQLKPEFKQSQAAKKLLKWAQKNVRGNVPTQYTTIAGWISEALGHSKTKRYSRKSA